MATYRCLYKHSSLVSHDSDDIQWVNGFQNLHLAESSLHQNKHTSSTNAGTGGSNGQETDNN